MKDIKKNISSKDLSMIAKNTTLIVLIIVLILPFSHAQYSTLSQASTEARAELDKAQSCLEEMKTREVPTARATELFEDAKTFYEDQVTLEQKTRRSNPSAYKIAIEYSEQVCVIKDNAFEASDELTLFEKSVEGSTSDLTLFLSPGDNEEKSDYDKIVDSYKEERFEDTIQLIDEGYDRLAEIEASQTTTKLYYEATTKSIKGFFINNWKKILIIAAIAIVLLTVFWKTIRIIKIKKRIKSLEKQKETLKKLIGTIQKEYFSTKKMSETEYRIKIDRFKDMIRDIDRQIPELKEELLKANKKENARAPSKIKDLRSIKKKKLK